MVPRIRFGRRLSLESGGGALERARYDGGRPFAAMLSPGVAYRSPEPLALAGEDRIIRSRRRRQIGAPIPPLSRP